MKGGHIYHPDSIPITDFLQHTFNLFLYIACIRMALTLLVSQPREIILRDSRDVLCEFARVFTQSVDRDADHHAFEIC